MLPKLAASLNSIYKKVESEGFGEDILDDMKGDLDAVSDRFGITPEETVLLAAILEKSGDGCDDNDLAEYVGCSNNLAVDGWRSLRGGRPHPL